MDRARMKRFALFVWCLLATACASSATRELHDVMRAALDHVADRTAVLVANDANLAWAQNAVGPEREVIAISQFEREHPGEDVPPNVAVQSARRERDGSWIVHLHVMAIIHVPSPSCGTGFELSVRRAGGTWVVTPLSETVC